ncbi:MFS transporter [Salinilacihabitans rarus]|uniref:MFS transporter n=1 Tax=Salinilacihabitans rarus TaxID=2961596 RepID=UPI0020C8F1B0|nr:MFS transporter [Salinilacihabitans rarus]
MSVEEGPTAEEADPLDAFRQFFALERDVLVLSLAMFAFSLGFQMTSRYMAEYLYALGTGAVIVGVFGSVGNVISALYPYPGGAISDRIGSRYALTVFGLLSTVGFAVWLVAPWLGPLAVPAVFLGLFLSQAWKSFGLGASFAIVKQAVPPSQLAAGFASTETFRRTAFLVGPLIAAALFYPFGSGDADVVLAFQLILLVAVVFGVLGTAAQHLLYDPGGDSFGTEFEGVSQLVADLRNLPAELRPLLVADTLVRFANGMVYVFFVVVVTRFLGTGLDLAAPAVGDLSLSPQSYFGVLLGLEMLVALLTMVPVAKAAERVGLKPVVALGFFVYAIFPILLINAPPGDAAVLAALFAFSGLRFAGLPAHKALIVGPAETGAGGRVTGAYYLVRNLIVIPSAALGGLLWAGFSNPLTGEEVFAGDPTVAFGIATAVGLVGTGYFALFGEEFEAYT